MSDVVGNEGIVVIPSAKLGHGCHPVIKPRTVQGVARSWLGGNSKCVHDTCIKQRLAHRSVPLKFAGPLPVRSYSLYSRTTKWRIGSGKRTRVSRAAAFHGSALTCHFVARTKRQQNTQDAFMECLVRKCAQSGIFGNMVNSCHQLGLQPMRGLDDEGTLISEPQ